MFGAETTEVVVTRKYLFLLLDIVMFILFLVTGIVPDYDYQFSLRIQDLQHEVESFL